MASTVYPEKPDERARAFFHALDLYNRSIAEALEGGISSKPQVASEEPAVAMPVGQAIDHVLEKKQSRRGGVRSEPDWDGVRQKQSGKEKARETACPESPGREELESAVRAKTERQKLQDKLDEWKVACMQLEQNIKAERSRASALKKSIQHVRDELEKILDRRGKLLVRKHRAMEECEDLERQVGEIVGRRGALMAELSRDRQDIRLLKKSLATAKAEKIELGRLVSAAKSEARRWANGIIHRAREAQNESEIRLTNMAVGGVGTPHREGSVLEKQHEGESKPRPSSERWNRRRFSPEAVAAKDRGARANYHVEEWMQNPPILNPSMKRETPGFVGVEEPLNQSPAKRSPSLSPRWTELDSARHSGASSSSCITIPLSGDVG
ncbi:hypothetical protein FOL47_006003 [Perkinsus chesapeaki]|uniref:Uncharacterized protein n=1 Tax=Perkinsus chesapeaki TaxID=330153 RepID=A0A7J6LUM4_PERCH|nr:hypothetical protein FOL47_006003 [Perkinsus chesapeaki]